MIHVKSMPLAHHKKKNNCKKGIGCKKGRQVIIKPANWKLCIIMLIHVGWMVWRERGRVKARAHWHEYEYENENENEYECETKFGRVFIASHFLHNWPYMIKKNWSTISVIVKHVCKQVTVSDRNITGSYRKINANALWKNKSPLKKTRRVIKR